MRSESACGVEACDPWSCTDTRAELSLQRENACLTRIFAVVFIQTLIPRGSGQSPWPGKLGGDFCNIFEALDSPGEA